MSKCVNKRYYVKVPCVQFYVQPNTSTTKEVIMTENRNGAAFFDKQTAIAVAEVLCFDVVEEIEVISSETSESIIVSRGTKIS